MADTKLIPIAYAFTFGNHKEDDFGCNTDSITLCGKEYVDECDQFADGCNGHNGKVFTEDDEEYFEGCEDEPYAYWDEIYEIMEELGYMESSEACFEPVDSMYIDLEALKLDFQQRGYELIEDSVDNSMLEDDGEGEEEDEEDYEDEEEDEEDYEDDEE